MSRSSAKGDVIPTLPVRLLSSLAWGSIETIPTTGGVTERRFIMEQRGPLEVQSELRAHRAQVQLVRYHFQTPPEGQLPEEDAFRVELCLNTRHRSARGCFIDCWKPTRYERVGNLFILPPGLKLKGRSDEASELTSVVCHLRKDLVLDLFNPVPARPTDQFLTASLDVRNTWLRTLLLRMAKEAEHPGFAAEMMVDSIAVQMAVELFRHGAALTQPTFRGGLAPRQLQLIDERLREVREAPSLSELASLCNVSVRHLTRGFQASRGCSLGAYVASHQIEHAKRMLLDGESATTVARTLGFSNVSNFCFAFRRAIGLSPGLFQQQFGRR